MTVETKSGDFLAGGGDMGARIRAHDWSATSLGPVENWPQSLRSTLSVCLNSAIPSAIYWGPDCRLLYNDAYSEILADRHPGALARTFEQVWPEAWPVLGPQLAAVVATGNGFAADRFPLMLMRRGQLQETHWFYSFSPIRGEGGSVHGVFVHGLDITEQVLTTQALQVSGKSLRDVNAHLAQEVIERTADRDRLWTLSRDPFVITDAEGRWMRASPVLTEILGWSEAELLGRTSEWMEHPDDRARTRQEVRDVFGVRNADNFENRFRSRTGDYRWFSWTAVPEDGMLYCVGRDITVQKEQFAERGLLEEALRQSQKMEAVGQLTGGLAHDFNNLLTGVTGSLELLQTRIGQGRLGDVDRYIQAAQGAAKRAAALTHRLLAFSRRQTLDPKPTDVNRLVAGMKELIRRTVGPAIGVGPMAATAGLWSTLVDPGQLENALLNLCINARDAMPDGGLTL